MKELSRFELAAIKRTAANVKGYRAKKAKLVAKIEKLEAELAPIDEAIEAWEAPIKAITGGYTSEEVLNGDMAATEALFEASAEVAAMEEGVSTSETVAEGPFNEPESEMPFAE